MTVTLRKTRRSSDDAAAAKYRKDIDMLKAAWHPGVYQLLGYVHSTDHSQDMVTRKVDNSNQDHIGASGRRLLPSTRWYPSLLRARVGPDDHVIVGPEFFDTAYKWIWLGSSLYYNLIDPDETFKSVVSNGRELSDIHSTLQLLPSPPHAGHPCVPSDTIDTLLKCGDYGFFEATAAGSRFVRIGNLLARLCGDDNKVKCSMKGAARPDDCVLEAGKAYEDAFGHQMFRQVLPRGNGTRALLIGAAATESPSICLSARSV
ncbi:hypothetical protein OH77DRAFT_135815 [Trametes cingulata]|nr:hypothetical protein OH77DRAFT_135815 [Trametes cingulata]